MYEFQSMFNNYEVKISENIIILTIDLSHFRMSKQSQKVSFQDIAININRKQHFFVFLFSPIS